VSLLYQGDACVRVNDYFAETSVSGDEILADWRWLIGPKAQLCHVTKAGDAILRDPADGSIHFLDTIAGMVQRIARDESDFNSLVTANANAEKWLMREIVNGQAVLGMRPGRDECLSFQHPPALGGELHPDNIEVCNISVHFSIAGQIHRQIKDLPPGTPITDIKVMPPGGAKRPWWRFW
jgi:hypothetical protein